MREAAALFSLPEMGWVRLPSQAFADLLMVTEFGHSFEEFLELEPSLSLSSVYLALYNYQEGGVVMQMCTQLLKAAIYDPGLYTIYSCIYEMYKVHAFLLLMYIVCTKSRLG